MPFAHRGFRAIGKVRWAASIPLLVASLAIAVSGQEPGTWDPVFEGQAMRVDPMSPGDTDG